MSSTIRGVAAVQIVLAAVLLVSGCSAGSEPTAAKAGTSTGTPSPTVASPSPVDITAPKVGQCWNATATLAAAFAWEGAPAASCAQPHNAVTFAVVAVPSSFDYSSAKASADARGYTLVSKVLPAATTRCSRQAVLRFLGQDLEKPLGFSAFIYVPTQAQYEAGARWVRCDLSVPAGAAFRTLPTRLKAAVSAHPAAYLACVAGSVKSGPTSSKFSDCNKARHWIATRSFDQGASGHVRFPGATVMRSRAARVCAPYSTGGWSSFATTAKSWKEGHTLIMCFKAR